MEKKLNAYLSDLVVEYHKLQNLHWYVKGSMFFGAHSQLEEYYDELLEIIDEVAEVMLMKGYKPVSNLKSFLSNSKVEEREDGFISVLDAYSIVLKDFNYLLSSSLDLKKEADDLVSAKLDDYISFFSKAVWMLGQTLNG